MSTNEQDPTVAVKQQAEAIVAGGEDIRPRLAEAVAEAATQSKPAGGMRELLEAVLQGAREGVDRTVPKDPDDVLRQVVDALGDGLSRAALAGQLAVEEATSAGRQFANEDLARLRDDLQSVRSLLGETVERILSGSRALTAGQVRAAMSHTRVVIDRLSPPLGQLLDAMRRHPIVMTRESLRAGVAAGQGAAGGLAQALGQMLQRAGEALRQQGQGPR